MPKPTLQDRQEFETHMLSMIRSMWADGVIPILIITTSDLSEVGFTHPFDEVEKIRAVLQSCIDQVDSGRHGRERTRIQTDRPRRPN